MSYALYHVDAFAGRPFHGNPAGVCVLPAPADDAWMQRVAAEMNLSETAFLVRRSGAAAFELRWFTPAVEVDLCGHATLASAHVLWERGHLPPGETVVFHTKSGPLTARQDAGGWIVMDFPAEPDAPVSPSPALVEVLGARPRYAGRNRRDLIVELDDEAAVRGLAPDLPALARLPVRGLIVTAAADGDYDFVSRFFAPAVGIPEDPVTGSAHCCLGPFWQRRRGKAALIGYQASPRGGVVRVRVVGDRVELAGRAVTVMEATLLV